MSMMITSAEHFAELEAAQHLIKAGVEKHEALMIELEKRGIETNELHLWAMKKMKGHLISTGIVVGLLFTLLIFQFVLHTPWWMLWYGIVALYVNQILIGQEDRQIKNKTKEVNDKMQACILEGVDNMVTTVRIASDNRMGLVLNAPRDEMKNALVN
jgi:hypothetical protein